MWQTLRHLASQHPGIDVDTFIGFATQPDIREQFKISPLPHQTVYGTSHGAALVEAFKKHESVLPLKDSHATIQRDIRRMEITVREAQAKLEHDRQAIVAVLQARCGNLGHKYTWHQIAGNGRICRICGFHDLSDD